MESEPVMVGSAVTALAAGVVALGDATGLYHINSAPVVVIITGALAAVSLITGLIARSRVTPVAKVQGAGDGSHGA